ncbi:MAG: non-canonical purine NTP pyrophosphatase, RdgB/HAM1 family [Rhodospirillaceae bacterium]|jgi:XTP/dITP diphosphohydrolase|nr:non-canonical purine NTP pyrophosphatase, RdgB/HAM1 family [Rhodospirillaceae bacterium]|tara:strand:+ start:5113 stop:5721 length:609 start_codon:yes stop_codon:yes gene_type:complete
MNVRNHRRLKGGPLVIASHNPGKVREIADLLQPFGAEVMSAADLNLAEPIETGATFAENAELKARAAAEASGVPALADDSGLVVAALAGQPGIHSARWAGPDKDFRAAMQKVEDELQGQDDRRAHFVCALALCWPDGHMEAFEGAVHGTLVWPPRGTGGFGYDPVFVADGHDVTFGEMAAAEKHRISHRARAFRKLVDACFR